MNGETLFQMWKAANAKHGDRVDDFAELPVVWDDFAKRVQGHVEQQHENTQVRRLRDEGRCPTCGADA